MVDKEMHPIEEVDFAHSRVGIEEEQVQLRIHFLHFLFRALGDDVVGDAAERLQAQHVADSIFDKGCNFARNEPAFAVLMVQAENLLRVSGNRLDVGVTVETPIIFHDVMDFVQVAAKNLLPQQA
jgi:hypothetical protein